LSGAEATQFTFDRPGVVLHTAVLRSEMEDWIADEVGAIAGAVDDALAAAGVQAAAVDRVFTTGGSSLVPAVQRILADRFGADRLVGGEELTSVAWGLAVSAARS
jgi:hypothetical chaperone protein